MRAKFSGEIDDALPAFRRSQHAPQRWEFLAVEKPRGHAVGRHHEILDEVLGSVADIAAQVAERIAVEHGPRFDRLEAERAMLVALRLERMRDAVLQSQIGIESGHRGNPRRNRGGAV